MERKVEKRELRKQRQVVRGEWGQVEQEEVWEWGEKMQVEGEVGVLIKGRQVEGGEGVKFMQVEVGEWGRHARDAVERSVL